MDILSVLLCLIVYGSVIAAGFVFIIALLIYLTTKPFPIIERFKEEESYNDPISKQTYLFPKIQDPQSIHLSVIVPAYNEEERLPPMLDEALEFLENRTKAYPSYKYEIIIVSDGSKDNTVKLAETYVEKFSSEKVRCLNLIKNRGKGGAVRMGIFSSRGATILFADADGASKFEDLVKLETALKRINKYDPIDQAKETSSSEAIVIGSRAHLEKESLATRSIFRAFDVELLYIAQKLNIPITEIPIRWTEIEGSKVTPIISWIQMGCDLGLIWLRYKIGAWKIKYKST